MKTQPAISSAFQVNVVVVGLDNSGKTTIIERLKVWACNQFVLASLDSMALLIGDWFLHYLWVQPTNEQSLEVAPTVGFTVDHVKRG